VSDTAVKVGEILGDGPSFRDAIHVAICPMVAGERLVPGQHVKIVNQKAVRAMRGFGAVGFVDPELEKPVNKGQRFYLWIYQRTVTSLRHQWTHPAFPEPVISKTLMMKFAQRVTYGYVKKLIDAQRSD